MVVRYNHASQFQPSSALQVLRLAAFPIPFSVLQDAAIIGEDKWFAEGQRRM